MKAYASVSGGVIFVPDENENESGSISYRDLLEEKPQEQRRPFGKRPAPTHIKKTEKAA